MKVYLFQGVNYLPKVGLKNNVKQSYVIQDDISSIVDNEKPKNITFGLANAGKLKKLFSHGLPCMYSGIEMIDPKKVQRFMGLKVYDLPISELLKILSQFESSIVGIEKQVYDLVKEQSLIFPEKTLNETFRTLTPIYERRLKKKQQPILEELNITARELPESFKYKYKLFMKETEDRFNKKPIHINFSKKEFIYKLEKIQKDIIQQQNPKAGRVVDKLLSVAQTFAPETNKKTEAKQKEIITFMEIILKRSVLKKNIAIKELLENSKNKLNHKKMLIPFTRKSFLYDLQKLIESLHNGDLQEKLLEIAQKLPTSQESKSAYIVKYSRESSEKIFYRLLWPSFASVEHIHPQSHGGEDILSNYGGATTRENTARQNILFTKQLKRRPLAKIYCQKYLDRLIEFAKKGVFRKYNMDIRYIEDFKQSIKTESKGSLVLDTSELYR